MLIISVNKFGFTLEKYFIWLYSLGAVSFSNVVMLDMVFGDCFVFAIYWSNAARFGVVIVLNFMFEKFGSL